MSPEGISLRQSEHFRGGGRCVAVLVSTVPQPGTLLPVSPRQQAASC